MTRTFFRCRRWNASDSMICGRLLTDGYGHKTTRLVRIETAACSIDASADWDGAYPKSDTACGAWADGAGRTTTSRLGRWTVQLRLGAIFLTRRSRTAWARANSCL